MCLVDWWCVDLTKNEDGHNEESSRRWCTYLDLNSPFIDIILFLIEVD